MATKTVKSRPGGPKAAGGKNAPKARTAGKAPAKSTPFEPFESDDTPYSFLKHAVLPAVACGILIGVVALEEGADLAVSALVAVCLAGVIMGMIKLKNSLYGG